MTFGNFAENYEFAAMKSAGISLQRAMGSLIVFILLFAYATFLFSNTIIPWSERKAINLKWNISKSKPSMAIVENVFSDIGPYSIKVDEKKGEKGEILKNVIIHKKNPKRVGNFTVIKAREGILLSDESSPVLSLKLIDGNYYNEIIASSYKKRKKRPFVKSSFKEYIINIDLSQLNDTDMDAENVRHPYKMMDISALNKQIDTLSVKFNNAKKSYLQVSKKRNGFLDLSMNEARKVREERKRPKKVKEAIDKKVKSNKESKTSKAIKDLTSKFPGASLNKDINIKKRKTSISAKKKDSLKYEHMKVATRSMKLDAIDSALIDYPKRNSDQIFSRAGSSVKGILRQVERQKKSFQRRIKILNKAEMQLHDKYALSFACVVLFFVGAPLGALIRKGGIGLPLVIAMLLFLIYHFLNLLAKNSAESDNITPFVGSWVATMIFLPLSIFMTYRATTDQGFGSFEFLARPLRKLFSKLKLNRFKTRE
jgi:lipopolysaccharide export system permease protein